MNLDQITQYSGEILVNEYNNRSKTIWMNSYRCFDFDELWMLMGRSERHHPALWLQTYRAREILTLAENNQMVLFDADYPLAEVLQWSDEFTKDKSKSNPLAELRDFWVSPIVAKAYANAKGIKETTLIYSDITKMMNYRGYVLHGTVEEQYDFSHFFGERIYGGDNQLSRFMRKARNSRMFRSALEMYRNPDGSYGTLQPRKTQKSKRVYRDLPIVTRAGSNAYVLLMPELARTFIDLYELRPHWAN